MWWGPGSSCASTWHQQRLELPENRPNCLESFPSDHQGTGHFCAIEMF